ncbi:MULTISPECIES: winged helix-turn-helix domain-containing tetratricopeptide repeat protein [unclassified Bradyrhizobium]|uniref:winged helix-turn-helix domain-containing tetratricopeptide repeat protein n=1 Tax=unclassified Bradyrhizobium TaxID=2631580 RepID=UPI0024783E3E|nr:MULTISPECIES: winged helix-turn-helix domain-containing tetratricopeptide repeat protein [unclassified Bradyrhizobium]WGS21714.1 winged helix-turn-helix domain-containing tetratricopeptide repeat protein [Bradyrhizobium sp. ISRA463]WGS28663.1 winged helix-turn-helix domain-containing tetratricopeptide repeat protein [Bradyrhizobium sp. ISRA464]
MQFLFDDYCLDADLRELRRGSELIAVGPKVFDLLLYLIRNREQVVTRDDLLQAVWNGRIVSESTLTSHINAVRKAISDTGKEQRLIRTVSRKGVRFVGKTQEVESSANTSITDSTIVSERLGPVLTLPDSPSIAILPFRNLSGDVEQDYFADGIVEDIITALSRIRWLFVIARNSSFTYKGRTVDEKQVGRELGVRYVVEGSVRQSEDRIRITGQLVDTATGTHLWAERFEGTLDDVFELQDQIATSIVGAVASQLERAEIERARRKPTGSLSAYDNYLRGMPHLHRGTRQAIDEALPLFYKAMQLDPEFASAHAMAAWCHFWRKINGWMTDRSPEIAEGVRLARLAVELGKDDAVALTRGGHALAHLTGDLDGGIALVDKALVLNPNLAAAWFLGGFLRTERGDPDTAIEFFTRAMRFSPLDPEMFRMQAGMAMSHLFAGRYDMASSWAEQSFRQLPSFLFVVAISAASHALAGRTEQADTALQHLRKLDPTFRISSLEGWIAIRRPEHLARFSAGLRKAGLPE